MSWKLWVAEILGSLGKEWWEKRKLAKAKEKADKELQVDKNPDNVV